MTKTTCGSCGIDLTDFTDLSLPQHLPCPHCGNLTRNIHITVVDITTVEDYMSATAARDGRTVAFRESKRQGRAASADENEDGSLSYILTGSSPQGEEDTLSTCRILIHALNSAGATWGEPSEPKMVGVADCVATSKVNGKEKLDIQVVRAVTDSRIWAKLAKEGLIQEKEVDKEVLVAMIKDSISKKASDKTIPLKIRSSVVLALDATRLPVLALGVVAQHCKAILGNWINTLGFQSVWLVGPNENLTWQLDTPA